MRVAPGDVPTDTDGHITAELVPVRYRQDFEKVPPEQVDCICLTGAGDLRGHLVDSVPGHDDANRA